MWGRQRVRQSRAGNLQRMSRAQGSWGREEVVARGSRWRVTRIKVRNGRIYLEPHVQGGGGPAAHASERGAAQTGHTAIIAVMRTV